MTVPTSGNFGEVFTRRWVVDTILDLVDYRSERDLADMRLVEPACGNGAFLGPIVERLTASALEHGRALDTLGPALRAYDLQQQHVLSARELCSRILRAAGASEESAANVAYSWVRQGDYLLPDGQAVAADFVVGNPPYIRFDDIAPELAASYRDRWSTMLGRGDIYVGFFERSLKILNEGGRIGFICADRWMRNQYGAALRSLISSNFSVDHVWTMHDVDAFEEKVSAYPAITVLSRAPQGSALVVDASEKFGKASAEAIASQAADDTRVTFEAPGATGFRLPHWFKGEGHWPAGSPRRLALLEYLNDNFPLLHDEGTGTRVSIGIATGADKVFITKDVSLVERERLLPLVMRRDLASGKLEWQGNYLVNPWMDDGALVDLQSHPKLAKYLESAPQLRDRFVAKRSPGHWYRTIDKVTPGLAAKQKLLIQDMKATIHPVLDDGGHYPHHNLYYVTSDSWDMEVLGGILLSRISQAFIEAYAVRMRGGTLRFQAQYLKRIRVPHQASLPADVRDELRRAFRDRDVDRATEAAARAYGLDTADLEDGLPAAPRSFA